MGAIYNILGFSTTTTGTGTITAGSALTGLRPLSTATDGTVISYSIKDASGNYEVGTGTVGGSGTTLTRTLINSTTGSLLSLSGTSEVRCSPNAADFNAIGPVAVSGTPTAGQVPIASSGTAAAWGTPSGGGGSPAGTGTELQYRNGGAFGAIAGSSFNGTDALRLPRKLYFHPTYNVGFETDTEGYSVKIRGRLGDQYELYGGALKGCTMIPFDGGNGATIRADGTSSLPTKASWPQNLNGYNKRQPWLLGQYGGAYAAAGGYHHAIGWSVWCGDGAQPTDTNANGGNAGNFDVWVCAPGAGKGTGVAGTPGKFRVMKDVANTELFTVSQTGDVVQTSGTFKPPQYTTATRPAWQNGAVIFDTDIDKLVIGGASAWEAVTSV